VESDNEEDHDYRLCIKCPLSIKNYETGELYEFLRLHQTNLIEKTSLFNSFRCFCVITQQLQEQITHSTQTHKRKPFIE
jgi:hypothetical protein